MAAPACEPRIRVAAVLLREGRVVLVKHRRGAEVYHLLPGGGVEMGETLEQALVREVAEETGLTCRVGRPLFLSDTIWPDESRHIVNVTFLAEITGGELAKMPVDRRVVGQDLVAPEDLVALDLRPPIAAEVARAAEQGFDVPATYLGRLWTEGHR